jgi:sugar phosphate isomerase/epimerase
MLASADPAEQIFDLARRAGAAGLVLDSGLPGGLYEELAGRLDRHREELPVWGMEGPCPATRAAAADLVALERDEAQAALEAAEDTLARAAEVGAGVVAIRLGEVGSLKGDWPAIRKLYLRAKLDESGRERLRKERAKRVAPHLDAARRALERLARRAESAGVRIGLRNPVRPIGLPSAIELALLRSDLAGAPIVPLLDLAAAHLGEAMGLGPVDGTVEGWKASPLALVADACASVTGLPPGRGELDLRAAVGALGKEARLCFHPAKGLTTDEILNGMEELRRLTGS